MTLLGVSWHSLVSDLLYNHLRGGGGGGGGVPRPYIRGSQASNVM